MNYSMFGSYLKGKGSCKGGEEPVKEGVNPQAVKKTQEKTEKS